MGEAISSQALRHTGNRWLRKNRTTTTEVATAGRPCGGGGPEPDRGRTGGHGGGETAAGEGGSGKGDPLPPHEH